MRGCRNSGIAIDRVSGRRLYSEFPDRSANNNSDILPKGTTPKLPINYSISQPIFKFLDNLNVAVGQVTESRRRVKSADLCRNDDRAIYSLGQVIDVITHDYLHQ